MRMDSTDIRLARLVGLASQKFLTDILIDALNHCRIANGQPTGLLRSSGAAPVAAAAAASAGTPTPPDLPSPGGKYSRWRGGGDPPIHLNAHGKQSWVFLGLVA